MKIIWDSDFSVYDVLNFTNKKFVKMRFLLFCKYYITFLIFACCLTKPKLCTIWPFTQKVC